MCIQHIRIEYSIGVYVCIYILVKVIILRIFVYIKTLHIHMQTIKFRNWIKIFNLIKYHHLFSMDMNKVCL